MMTKLTAPAVLGLALCLAGGGYAQEVTSLAPERVREELRADALISGNWLVGAHAVSARSAEAPRLMSYVPGGAEWQGQTICARATDKTGRYSALLEYRVPAGWQGGLIDLEYRSDHSDHLRGRDESDSGVALHRGGCDRITNVFLPVLWNAERLPGGQDAPVPLILNLNAGRADSLLATARTAAGTDLPVTCARMEEEGVGFNYQCRLNVPADLAGVVQLEITRLRRGRMGKPRVAELHLFPPGAG